jgi:hypothetical protein
MSEKQFNDLMAVLQGLRTDFQQVTKALESLRSPLGQRPAPELPESKEPAQMASGPRPNLYKGKGK